MSSIAPRTLDRALDITVVGSFSRIGFVARRALFGWDAIPEPDLHGRIVVITGGSSGIGLAAAHQLAARGAQLHLVGRDARRLDTARNAIVAAAPGAGVDIVVADLASLDAVASAAETLRTYVPRIDVLIHDAGLLVHDFERTVDGLEVTAQVHVVAPFLLTAQLLPNLRASDHGRVITVSSGGMYTQRLTIGALEARAGTFAGPTEFDGVRAYANAKRAQVVLNEQWPRHRVGTGIEFHAMHPGWADTPGLQHSLPGFRRVMRPLLRSADQGADTITWLAGSPEAAESSGRFWLDRGVRPTTLLPWTRTPDADAERLWGWCVAQARCHDLIGAWS